MKRIMSFFIVLLIPSFLWADASANLPFEISRVISSVAELGNSDVQAGISNSVVTLTGVVSDPIIKTKIIENVSNLNGVREVKDEILVDANYKKKLYSDLEIKQAVENALRTEQLSFSNLEVNSGTVFVTADLQSFVLVDQMLAVIRGIPGVKGVKPTTKVKGQPYLSDVTKNY